MSATTGLTGACPPEGSSQAPGTAEDEAAIRRLIAEMTDGFNKHDADAATRMYTPDADFVSVRGDAAKGRREIEQGLASIFRARAKAATLTTEDVRIRLIRPDVAVVHVTNTLDGLVTPDGQKLPPHRELSIRVLVKDDGAWRVTAFHNTMIRPFEAGSPGNPDR